LEISLMKNLYFTSRVLRHESAVIAIQHDGPVARVMVEETIFHPQGGGQKSDVGTLGGSRLLRAEKSEEGVVHFVEQAALVVGQVVHLEVDEIARQLNSRLHTAGHLIAGVGQRLDSGVLPVRGHHWPDEARVEFTVPTSWTMRSDFQETLQSAVDHAVATDAEVKMEVGADGRRVTISGFDPVPCGGTHVATLAELGKVLIRNVNVKRGTLRIGYDLADAKA
jgi:alanyl-tRNA synthetase